LKGLNITYIFIKKFWTFAQN